MGVIHRDIKPTNLFLVKSGIVKVLDLGFGELVGLAVQAGNIFDTDAGIVVGTTDFMSPEQVMDQEIDARTDLFSLGCTMYRLLTAKYAFPGATPEDRLVRRIKTPHEPISDVRPGLSPDLIAVLDRLLEIRPEDRFPSAALAADALEALIAPGPIEQPPTANPRKQPRSDDDIPVPKEPEAPLDWSMIESGLSPRSRRPAENRQLVSKPELKSPASKSLATHRTNLEKEGADSGREVQKQYRNEVIQMKRALAELRSSDPAGDHTSEDATWYERFGEKVGDFLAEPSAGVVLIGVLLLLLVVAIAFGLALS
jgi:serine/threonine protein kinase